MEAALKKKGSSKSQGSLAAAEVRPAVIAIVIRSSSSSSIALGCCRVG
jgi:hypothetical protein